MAWRSYIAPADDPNGNAGKLIWTDDQGHFQVGGTSPDGGASSTPAVTPTPSASATGGVDAGALQWALNAQIAAQAAKTNADRLNLLDIPAEQKREAIADADLKLRQAQDARAALSDAQKLQLDQQAAALNTAKVFGYGQTLGNGTGDKILAQADALRSSDAYKQVVASGDPARKRQMEIGAIATATGLPMDRAGALYDQLGQRFQATTQLPSGADIDRLLAQDPSFQTPTLENQQGQTDTALKYLQLRAPMAGRPEDAFTYAATLRDTPQSIRNIINQAAGRVNLPGLGFPGSTPAAGAQQTSQVVANGGAPGIGASPNGDSVKGPMYDGEASGAAPGGMTASNQIAPQDYQRANPYLQKMVWAGYGANNMDPDAEKANYLKSLPQYRQSQTGRIAA